MKLNDCLSALIDDQFDNWNKHCDEHSIPNFPDLLPLIKALYLIAHDGLDG